MSTKKISAHYRPDIDGLRAIAVISVLLFHLMIRPALGGFVGVDIFFVISGYLIGNIVLGEVAEGRFSLRAFYERRFRRILPALFVMMLATLAILVATAYPVSLAQYSRNAMAAVFSVSNIYFWRMSGYFDAASNQNFLLHTWSLGVEEQFYLLFPPLVMAIGRFAKGRVVAILGLLAVVSFLASVWLVGHAPSAGFYLLPSRAWELLLGTLAGRVRFNWLAAPVQRNLVALAGAVAVLAPIVAYREATPVPGVAALLPCLGTAMIIVSGGHGETLVSRVLSARPAVFVGLISYSLYLWHWPLLVLAQELKPAPYLGRFEKLAVLALSFGCAILSWRYVERPFRGGAAASSILRTTGIAAASATALLGGLILAAGLPGRFDSVAERYAAHGDFGGVEALRKRGCFIEPDDGFSAFNRQVCLTPGAARPNVLVMGDSHAASLHSGLVEAMPYANVMQATASSCRPLLASRTVDKAYCASLMSDVFDRFLPEQLPDVVVIASYWGRSDLANVPPTLKWFAAHGIPVVVIGPMTIYDMPLPGLLALAASRHDDNLVESRRVPGREALDTWLRAAADRDGAGFVSMIETLCHERCTTRTSDDTPLLFDVSHLTPEGARLVAPAIVAVVEARLARTPASKPDVASEGESGANQAAPNDRGRGATPG